MKRIVLTTLLLMAGATAHALDLAGIHLAESMKVGDVPVQLNGGGIRTKWFFKIYVAALYLPQKQTSAEAIISDGHEHRVVLYMLHGLGSKRLYGAFHEGIENNHTAAEMKALEPQLNQMKQIFDAVDEVKTGDIIMLDYLPAGGTRITVNGTERGTIAGAEFNRALLKIWLGTNPVQDDLKKGLLGG